MDSNNPNSVSLSPTTATVPQVSVSPTSPNRTTFNSAIAATTSMQGTPSRADQNFFTTTTNNNNNLQIASRVDIVRRNSGASEDDVIHIDRPLMMNTTNTTELNHHHTIQSPNTVVSDGQSNMRVVSFNPQQQQLGNQRKLYPSLDGGNSLNSRLRGELVPQAEYLEDIRRRNREVYGNQHQIWRNQREKTKSMTNVHDAIKKPNKSGLTHKIANNLHLSGGQKVAPLTIQELKDQGYIIKMTSKGQPYIVREKALVTISNPQQQMTEKSKKLSFFCRWSSIEDTFGLGVKLYFDFARLMVVLNALLFCIQFFNIIVHFVVDYQEILNNLTLDLSIIDQLYSSSYSRSLYWVWITTNALCILISVAFGPMYWWIIHTYYEKRDLYDCEDNLLDSESDKIKQNQKIHILEYLLRMFLSYLVFLIFMMILFSVTLGFTILQNVNAMYELADSTFSANGNILTVISIAISFVISVMSFIWKKICVYLTNFERHKTWSAYRKHNTFKFLFFKLFSVFVMGFTKGFFATPCVIKVMGNQYMIQILIDFFMSFFVELAVPFIVGKIRKVTRKDKTIPVPKPDFDVSEEYLELIYRQYLIYNGFVSFPLITFIGFVASVVEVYLDKFRLLKVSSKPPLTTGSVKSVVTFFAMLAALLPILNWAGGNLYILTGYYWCNAPSDIECSACTITDNGRFPNLIKAMFEST